MAFIKWATGVNKNPYKWNYGPRKKSLAGLEEAHLVPGLLSTWIVEGVTKLMFNMIYILKSWYHLVKMKASSWSMLLREGGIQIPKYINLFNLSKLQHLLYANTFDLHVPCSLLFCVLSWKSQKTLEASSRAHSWLRFNPFQKRKQNSTEAWGGKRLEIGWCVRVCLKWERHRSVEKRCIQMTLLWHVIMSQLLRFAWPFVPPSLLHMALIWLNDFTLYSGLFLTMWIFIYIYICI